MDRARCRRTRDRVGKLCHRFYIGRDCMPPLLVGKGASCLGGLFGAGSVAFMAVVCATRLARSNPTKRGVVRFTDAVLVCSAKIYHAHCRKHLRGVTFRVCCAISRDYGMVSRRLRVRGAKVPRFGG